MYIFELAHPLELAYGEVSRLGDVKRYGNLAVGEMGSSLFARLAFTRSVYEFVFRCRSDELDKNIAALDIKMPYAVRTHGLPEKEIADKVYASQKAPRIDLSTPSTELHFFGGDKIICGIYRTSPDTSYNKRKPHLRPELHPSSLDPRIARACINLTGLSDGVILDPFCGSGGILIEAGMMGFDVHGIEIEAKQVHMAKINLGHYLNTYSVERGNALTAAVKADAIVTDPPYGKNTRSQDITGLYRKFLDHAVRCAGLMIIIFPDFLALKSIVEDSPWHLEHSYRIYVHRSLSRTICLLTCPDGEPNSSDK